MIVTFWFGGITQKNLHTSYLFNILISKDIIAKTFANKEELPPHQERVGNSSKGLSKVFVIRVILFISMYRKQTG